MDNENSSFASIFRGYHSNHDQEKRALAVAAALELLRADARGVMPRSMMRLKISLSMQTIFKKH